MLVKKFGRKKLHQTYIFGMKDRLFLFLTGKRSNPYRINTYNGTRFLQNQ